MKVGRSQLTVNATSLLAVQAANYLIPLALVPFLARTLGIERFGLFSFAQAYTQYFILATEYGFNLSASRLIAMSRDNQVEVSRIFWSTFVARAILAGACLATMLAIAAVVPRLRPDFVTYLAASLGVVGSALIPIWYFQGMEYIRQVALLVLGTRAIATVATFLVVDGPDDVSLTLAIQALGTLLAGLAAWVLIARRLPLIAHRVTRADLKETYRAGWYVFLSSVATSLYTNSNAFILGLLTSNTQVGYFSVAEKISRAATGFVGPISQAVYPRVASLATTSRDEAFTLLRKVLLILGAFGVAVCLVLLAAPGLLIWLIAGPGWESATPVLRWLSVVPLVVAVSSVLGTLTMLNFGLDRPYAKVVAGAGVINVATLVLGSTTLGANGAALALVLTECIVVAAMARVLQTRGMLKNVVPWFGPPEPGAGATPQRSSGGGGKG